MVKTEKMSVYSTKLSVSEWSVLHWWSCVLPKLIYYRVNCCSIKKKNYLKKEAGVLDQNCWHKISSIPCITVLNIAYVGIAETDRQTKYLWKGNIFWLLLCLFQVAPNNIVYCSPPIFSPSESSPSFISASLCHLLSTLWLSITADCSMRSDFHLCVHVCPLL